MLYVFNHHGDEFHWHTDHDMPAVVPETVNSIHADCDELAYILREHPQYEQFTPDTGRVRVWRGATARRLYLMLYSANGTNKPKVS